jgi:hypothetical protein
MAIIYGSKSQVYHGTADETRGGLVKKDIVRLDDGYGNVRYKSKKQQKSGRSKNSFRAKWAKAMKKARKELEKEGAIPKGAFVPVGGKTKAGKALLKRIRSIMKE